MTCDGIVRYRPPCLMRGGPAASLIAKISYAGQRFPPEVRAGAAGVVVHVPPAQIELSFSEAVEPAFSTVEVLDQAGGHAERGKPEIDPGDAKLLRIKIKLTGPGVYKVVWRVLSLDTHRSSSSFTFALAP